MPSGGYQNMTVRELYTSAVGKWRTRDRSAELAEASGWIEACNIMELRLLISDWFRALEDGSVEHRHPDPTDNTITQERADRLVVELDADFEMEHGRFANLHADAGPQFTRLSPITRIAFAQAVFAVVRDLEDIEREAWERLRDGEKLPPPLEYKNVDESPSDNSLG
jgi:hypothetical protein